MTSRLLTLTDIAKVLRMAPESIREFCEQGLLPAQNVDGDWVMWADELKEWMADNPPAPPIDDDDPLF